MHIIPARFYTHKLHLLFNSLHILRQLLYRACAVFQLDFRLYQFLWVFLPCIYEVSAAMLKQCGYHLGSAIDDNPLAVLASQYCGALRGYPAKCAFSILETIFRLFYACFSNNPFISALVLCQEKSQFTNIKIPIILLTNILPLRGISNSNEKYLHFAILFPWS